MTHYTQEIDPSQIQDITEHPYYKRLQKDIRKRAELQKLAVKNQESQEQVQLMVVSTEDEIDRNKKLKDKTKIKTDDSTACDLLSFDIEDDVRLSTMDWGRSFLDEDDLDTVDISRLTHEENNEERREITQQKDRKKSKKKIVEMVIKNIAYRIDFKNRIPELKELFRYNIIQSKSHNYYLSKFSEFKVGVVGQVLSWIGVPISELKEIRNESLNEAFKENIVAVAENVYHTELALLIHGKTRKSRRMLRVYSEEMRHLIQQMDNLGRCGYWSKVKMLEMRFEQSQKIKDEFIKEKLDLEYEIDYRTQEVVL
tara:strand:- start:327 stop:1262 length:936 start_codon:yes stop_codon:yes gene_type:complete